MSLRIRLNIFLTLLFLLIFIGGSFFVIDNARQSIREEITSTANLTLQLVKLAVTSTRETNDPVLQNKVLEQIGSIKSIRHLEIELYHANNPNRSRQNIATGASVPKKPVAPAWFTKLVTPPKAEFRHVIDEPGARYTEIIIKANPSDEITESWNEVKNVLVMLVIFLVLANVTIYFTLGWGLKPVITLTAGLENIEKGNFQLRLPKFTMPEFSKISEKFNIMAEGLQQSREENRILTQRSLSIQENERKNLAYELHDELGQSITAIKAVAVSIEQQKSNDREIINQSAETIINVSNRMYDVARKMMRRLRPQALDELGLIKTLQNLIDDWNSLYQDTFCYFSFSGDFSQLNDDVNINLYRIIQECLTNVIKHASASAVKINLVSEFSDEFGRLMINLVIEDDGVGFEKDRIRSGLGFLGIRERAESLGGQVDISSSPGMGTRIVVKIPIGD